MGTKHKKREIKMQDTRRIDEAPPSATQNPTIIAGAHFETLVSEPEDSM